MIEMIAELYAQKHLNRRLYESKKITTELYETVNIAIDTEIDTLERGPYNGHNYDKDGDLVESH